MSHSRKERARLARHTINKMVPSMLAGDPLAQAGVDASIVLQDLPSLARNQHPLPPIIHVWKDDTLSAAQRLLLSPSPTGRLAILNMASPLRPGGGVLTGATSQEEYLCVRTTLYPALKDEFYRLPDMGLIYTKDVLVFRDSNGNDLPKSQRFYVDVVTSAMLRFPELVHKNDSLMWEDKDRELVFLKMRMVLPALVKNQVSRAVL